MKFYFHGDFEFVQIKERFDLRKGNYKSFTLTVTLNLFKLRRDSGEMK